MLMRLLKTVGLPNTTYFVPIMGHDTLFTRAHLEGLETENMTHDLHEGHVASQFVDGVNLRAIDMLVGVVLQQVAIGKDTKLLAQYLFPVWSHPWEKLYVLIENVHS